MLAFSSRENLSGGGCDIDLLCLPSLSLPLSPPSPSLSPSPISSPFPALKTLKYKHFRVFHHHPPQPKISPKAIASHCHPLKHNPPTIHCFGFLLSSTYQEICHYYHLGFTATDERYLYL
jgi:hypothetical protein